MSFLPGMFPGAVVAGGGAFVEAEYMGAFFSTSNREGSDGYSFSGVPIGPVFEGRVVVFGVSTVGSGDTASFFLEVDGVPAERVMPNSSRIQEESNHPISFFAIEKPVGTTCDLFIDYDFFAELPNIIVFVWVLKNAASAWAFSAGWSIGNAASAQIGLVAPERGVLLFCGGHQNTNPSFYSSAELVDTETLESRVYSAAQLHTKKENAAFTETRSWGGGANYNFAGVGFVPFDTKYPFIRHRTFAWSNLNNTPSNIGVTVPSSAKPGDLLVIVASVRGGGSLATPTGFTELLADSNGNVTNHKVFYKIATGDEATVTLVAASGARWSVFLYVIGNHRGMIAGLASKGSSASPTPPPLTPPWGESTNLWIVNEADTINPGTDYMGEMLYPDGFFYGDYTEQVYLGDVFLKGVTAVRSHRAATLIPGSWQIVQSGAWVCSTIAIR